MLGRSLPPLIDTIGQLEARGGGFKSVQESVDTTTPRRAAGLSRFRGACQLRIPGDRGRPGPRGQPRHPVPQGARTRRGTDLNSSATAAVINTGPTLLGRRRAGSVHLAVGKRIIGGKESSGVAPCHFRADVARYL